MGPFGSDTVLTAKSDTVYVNGLKQTPTGNSAKQWLPYEPHESEE